VLYRSLSSHGGHFAPTCMKDGRLPLLRFFGEPVARFFFFFSLFFARQVLCPQRGWTFPGHFELAPKLGENDRTYSFRLCFSRTARKNDAPKVIALCRALLQASSPFFQNETISFALSGSFVFLGLNRRGFYRPLFPPAPLSYWRVPQFWFETRFGGLHVPGSPFFPFSARLIAWSPPLTPIIR